MQASCKPAAAPLFGYNTDHSSVPAKPRRITWRRDGQARPTDRRVSASLLTAASTIPVFQFLGMMPWIVAILAASMLSGGAALAERTSQATHRANGVAVDPLAAYVVDASRRFAVPEHWIRAVMHVESDGRQHARSSKGAIGLMQIMPGTWTELRSRYRLGADPYDVRDNIMAGTAYIRELSDRYGTPGFLAAYNAGPGRYERHLATGRPLPKETQAYIAKLTPTIEAKQVIVQIGAVGKSSAWASSSLFATHDLGNSREGRLSPDMRQPRSLRAHEAVDISAIVPQSGNMFVHRTGEIRSR